jgi:hypothetical protein
MPALPNFKRLILISDTPYNIGDEYLKGHKVIAKASLSEYLELYPRSRKYMDELANEHFYWTTEIDYSCIVHVPKAVRDQLLNRPTL